MLQVSPIEASSSYRSKAAVTAILIAVIGAMLATSPVNYDFGNPDAPRHALNGAFVLDALRAFPWRDPMGYAVNYYLHYPALSIGFYPPLFYTAEAAVYAVIGVSHFAAQFTVALFAVALISAAYCIAKLVLPRWTALSAALLFAGSPGIALWVRQVMLDIPAHAMLLVSVLFFTRYLQRGGQRGLWFAAFALLAAVYIKFTAAFIVLPMAVALITAHGWRIIFKRDLIAVAVTTAMLVIPELLLVYRFSAVNLDNLAGHAAGAPVISFERWTYYLQQLPGQLGWLTVVLAVPGSYFLWSRAKAAGGVGLAAFFVSWTVAGYFIFSFIRVHEARHDLMILFPVVLAAVTTLTVPFRASLAPLAAPVSLLVGAGTVLWSLATPVEKVEGYAAIAHEVAAVTPANGVVLVSVFRDGNLVFAMRALEERRDIWILRANKWLLAYSVDPAWGLSEAGYDRQELIGKLQAHGVSVAVSQRGFWADIKQMAVLQDVLGDPSLYHASATFPVTGDLWEADLPTPSPSCPGDNAGCRKNFADILLPLGPLPQRRLPVEFDLPFLGQRLREKASP